MLLFPHLASKPFKKRGIVLFAMALVLGSALPLIRPAAADEGHGRPHGSMDHSHEMLEIPMGQPIPTIDLAVYPDPVRGWNLEIQTTNFRFTPENVNQANQPNQGHGHLYINGENVSRVYGTWLHLPSLPSGSNEITVSLNANNHAALAHNGAMIESTVVVEVPE
jgi:hypothetical protein